MFKLPPQLYLAVFQELGEIIDAAGVFLGFVAGLLQLTLSGFKPGLQLEQRPLLCLDL